jgi:hypothetical protein
VSRNPRAEGVFWDEYVTRAGGEAALVREAERQVKEPGYGGSLALETRKGIELIVSDSRNAKNRAAAERLLDLHEAAEERAAAKPRRREPGSAGTHSAGAIDSDNRKMTAASWLRAVREKLGK